MSPQFTINIIRAFDGPRHARLERLWQDFAAKNADLARLHIHEGRNGRRHAQNLDELWEAERCRSERYTILTEFDFLPDPEYFFLTHRLSEKQPCVATQYCTRDPVTKRLNYFGKPGAWYILFDKWHLAQANGVIPHLNFEGTGEHRDPANDLQELLGREFKKYVGLIDVEDCYPRHYGVHVGAAGEHLFWSRHYNDPPDRRLAGFAIGDVQRKVDAAIDEYEQRLAAEGAE